MDRADVHVPECDGNIQMQQKGERRDEIRMWQHERANTPVRVGEEEDAAEKRSGDKDIVNVY